MTYEYDVEYDVFISHASEDKDSFVRLLAEQLRDRGYRVWYDEFSLRMGDSLRRSIDYGLANTRYGIVVISPNFLRKEWPQRELDGLTAREINGSKNILPIWHQVEYEDVVRYSPTLADRLAVKTSQGMDRVVNEIIKVLGQQSPDTTPSRYVPNDDLSSECDVNYTPLRNLLAVKNWKDADKETDSVMLEVVGRKKGDWIRDVDLLNFPCTDLRTIDSLWVKYSKGRFGFSVQKNIYVEVGGIPDGKLHYETWKNFLRNVGWSPPLTQFNVKWDIVAPKGHLPASWWGGCGGVVLWNRDMITTLTGQDRAGSAFAVHNLFSRIQACKL